MVDRILRFTQQSFLSCIVSCSAVAVLLWTSSPILAQTDSVPAETSDAEPTVDTPVIVVTAASFDRLLGHVDYVFDTIGRPELQDLVGGMLARARDFKGMRRDAPFGLMVFLEPGLAPTPVPIGFIPVDDMSELIQTVSLSPGTLKKLPGKENRYELSGRRGRLQILVDQGYAFLAANAEQLDRKFPDPISVTKSLTARYDIAAALNLQTVSQTTRTVFLELLKSRLGAELQQRDGESDAAYRVRKVNGENIQDTIELLLTEGESLVLGAHIASETGTASIELKLDVESNGKFAQLLRDMKATGSYFAALHDEEVPMTASGSWMLNESDKRGLTEILNAGEERAKTAAIEHPELDAPIKNLFEALHATVDDGHANFFAQFTGNAADGFVLTGGIRISHGNTASTATASLLNAVRNIKNNGPKIVVNAYSYKGVAVHTIEPKGVGKSEERLYHGKPTAYVGTGPKAVWFAVGGHQAWPTLKKAIDKVMDGSPTAADRVTAAPFQFVLRVKQWLGLGGDPNSRQAQLANEAFSKDNDRLRIDVRPTETGIRLRFEMEEGFLRIIGLGIASRIDRSQRL